MNLNSVSIVSLFICFFSTITASNDNPTHSSAEVLINCGSIDTFAARNGREWHGDGHKFSSFVKITGSSTTSHVVDQKLISDPIPYKTARISRYEFSYKLQINPGQKILRFHFGSALYHGFKLQYKDLFDVEAGPFTLLRNFSATLVADALGVNSFVKEFCVDIKEDQIFNITFSPTTSQFRDTYAFINGIEIVSVPASRSYFHIEDVGVQFIGKSPVYIDSNTALEIIRRLNTKQEFVLLSTDHIGDGLQIRGRVPEQGGKKANNITWKTPVDVGFGYVVRLHFFRLGFKIAEIGGFRFEVLINGMVVITNSDTFKERDEDSMDWYRDYSVVMNGRKQVGKRDLLISLVSNDEFLEGHGLLKGFEILKLSNRDNSLASQNPLRLVNPPSYQTLKILPKNTIVNGAILVLVLLNIISYTFWMIQEAGHVEEENMPPVKAGRLCCQFSLAEIQLATKNFSRSHLIGRGGFGKVYKGTIGNQTMAIKRLKSNSSQGAHEFLTEIETLMEVQHVNLVSLIGYCNECKEMILVYEYMESGSLADHLFKLVWDEDDMSSESLTWKQRLNICIGAGRGLDYLHTGVSIIHRDVKASNILLDEDFTAKVADFGLAKSLMPSKLQQSHVSTQVKGTFGYLDPEYLVTGKLTRKSDTYAFGVVLLEVLCGRRAIDREYLEEEQILTKWALESISKGETERIVASNLKHEISNESLMAFVGVAERCLHNDPKKRPTMAEVVLQLQFVLELQETSTYTVSNDKTYFNDETHACSSSVKLEKPFENENLLMPAVTVQLQTDDRAPASEDVNTQKPLLNDQFDNNVANFQPPSGRKDQRTTGMPKIFRLWPWGVIRNKGVPSGINKSVPSAPPPSSFYLPLWELKCKSVNRKSIEEAVPKDQHTINSNSMSFNVFLAQTPDMKFVGVPSIPFNELKGMLYNFGQNSARDEDFFHGVLKCGQIAAIKVLRHNKQPDQEFLAQVSIISSLKHENLVELLGYSMDGPLRILAYERTSKGSLHDILHVYEHVPEPTLTWTQKVKIAVGTAKGLEYLHEKGHVHCNIRSGNILLFGGVEVPKITNFGLENPKYDDRMKEQLRYRTPEFINGEPTSKTDVYNFGVILLELLLGSKPQLKTVAWDLNETEVIFRADAKLNGNYPPNAVAKMVQVAFLCMQSPLDSRPNMSTVVKALQPLLDAISLPHV